MVLPAEAHIVHILGGVVRWICVEKSVRAVIVPYQGLKILVLYDNIRQPVFQIPNQAE